MKELPDPQNENCMMGMLEFGKFNGKFDIKLEGLGFNYFVSDVQNTVLKTVGKNIPTVAELTQGEVVSFAGNAVQQMGAEGFNVSHPSFHVSLCLFSMSFYYHLTDHSRRSSWRAVHRPSTMCVPPIASSLSFQILVSLASAALHSALELRPARVSARERAKRRWRAQWPPPSPSSRGNRQWAFCLS